MGNGYSQDSGTDRLWCSTPRPETPDNENSSSGFLAVSPNVNHGNTDILSSTLCVARYAGTDEHGGINIITTNDFSLEFWIRRLFPDSITNWQTSAAAATGYCISGVAQPRTGNIAGTAGAARRTAAGIQVRGANFEAFFQSNQSGINFVSRTFTLGFGWHHVAITYDRSGNMETFVDGTSFGTNAIDTDDFDTGVFCASYCNITDQAAASGKAEVPYVLAGMATHRTLLTNAQIANSHRNISLQALGANTYLTFFYDSIQLRRSSWTTVAGFTPTTQAETRSIFTTTTRSELATIIADARMQIVEVTSANTDLDNGGIVGAAQMPDATNQTGERAQAYALCENINIGSTVGDDDGIAIGPGLPEVTAAAEEVATHFSPALGMDPTWPPMRGTSGTDYA